MTPTDDRLRRLFAQDQPPAVDPAFSAQVMERLLRRRWVQDMAFLGGASALGGLVLWGVWPVLQPALVALSGELAPAAVGLALAVCAMTVLGGQVFGAAAVES